jgi:hypothetical protein
VRKILLLSLAFFMVCGFHQNDHYRRLDMLIGNTVGMMAQATALPIVAGADPKLVLADQQRSYAWEAFINSRKRTAVYSARQLNAVIKGQATPGQSKQFVDVFSGAQYARQDERLAREALYTQYFMQEGTVAQAIERIAFPEDVLHAAFAVELPELPDPDDPAYDKKLQNIRLRPGQPLLDPEALLDEEFMKQSRLSLEIVSGNYTEHGKRIVSVPRDGAVRVGVRVGNSKGKEPYALLLPVPESAELGLGFVEPRLVVPAERPLKFAQKVFPAFDPEREPLAITYTVPDGVTEVFLSITSATGKKLYQATEPVPDPKNPVPFVWLADAVEPGEYVLALSARQQDKTIEAEPAVVRVTTERSARPLRTQRVQYVPGSPYYGYIELKNISIEESGLTKLFVWLQGTENAEKKPISSALYFSQSSFARQYSALQVPAVGRMGGAIPITVTLRNKNDEPIANARVRLYSNRNERTSIDVFSPEEAQTDLQGIAKFTLRTAVPGEVGIYAQTDLLWVNERPSIVLVTSSGERE